jgi:hypothetical protein
MKRHPKDREVEPGCFEIAKLVLVSVLYWLFCSALLLTERKQGQ